MPEFLQLLPPPQALARLLEHLPASKSEEEIVDTASALRRVTAGAVIAAEPLPAFPRSTVDGFAVRARDTHGASDSLPMYLALAGEVPMGAAPEFALQPGQAALIHTGGMLPNGADAVVMLEWTQVARQGEIEVLRAVADGDNIIRAGEDVAPGQEVLPTGTLLLAPEIGGLMALGMCQVRVRLRPRVGILSSGDEVIPPGEQPRPGQVRDINSYALSALVEANGAEAVRYGIIPDSGEALEAAARAALRECDCVVITAGSSASTRDLTAEVIGRVGSPGVLVHGVNVRPGKPTILGVCDGKAVFGLPGNPVSALVIAGLFVVPVIERLLGLPPGRPLPALPARLAVNLSSQAGREDWVPVRLARTAHGWDAEPVFYKSNLIFNLARADGYVVIPADSNGLAAGEAVQVVLA